MAYPCLNLELHLRLISHTIFDSFSAQRQLINLFHNLYFLVSVSMSSLDEKYFLFLEKLWLYVPPVIIIVGVVGNILTLIIMNRKTFRWIYNNLRLTLHIHTGLYKHTWSELNSINSTYSFVSQKLLGRTNKVVFANLSFTIVPYSRKMFSYMI